MDIKDNNKIKILLEMRPALDGYAGIPQEVRLLFRGLRKIETVEVEGMLQSSGRTLAKGTRMGGYLWKKPSKARMINRYSKVIISLAEAPYRSLQEKIFDLAGIRFTVAKWLLSSLLGVGSIKLTRFESRSFEDFTWRTLFAKTLPSSDFDLVAPVNHRVCTVPWHSMHMVGLTSLSFGNTPKYPTLDTSGIDIFIGQTPYPGRVKKNTQCVIRYHDAIPILMPHAIPNKSIHQATHFNALMGNVKSGAWFACVSNASKNDLISLFPEASDRAVTIHNMVSHHYFNEESPFERVPGIIRSRLYDFETQGNEFGIMPKGVTAQQKKSISEQTNNAFKYLLVVSTIEPRKNHATLLAAWESLKTKQDPDLKLIVVGSLGWDYKHILAGFKTWIERGELFMLHAVPAADLRVLYHHAAATVCPSFYEGFDFSGVEAMRCGGVVVASDIPVHQEVYEDAAEYFDPYSTMSLVNALKKTLYEPDAQKEQERMRQRGEAVSSRYLPEEILPQWERFLQSVVANR